MVDSLTDRTRVRRLSDNASYERSALDQLLDEALVAHVGIVDADQPFVLPMGCARRGDDLILHGSSGSRLMRRLADGAAACATVTVLDGLVYARSAFESSMNYRSALILGCARGLHGDDELDALRTLSDHLLPGRWDDIRPPTTKERAATITVALPLEEWSMKVSAGAPEDDPDDLDTEPWRSIWAGHVPVHLARSTPIADDHVPPGVAAPSYLTHHRSGSDDH